MLAKMDRVRQNHFLLYMALFLALSAGLYLARANLADDLDFHIFYSSAQSLLAGQPLYGNGFGNPPYVAIFLLPIALLPERISLALFGACLIVIALLLARHFRLNITQASAFLFSPFVVFDVYTGQINLLVVAATLLPVSMWMIAAIAKPQVAVGLILRPTRAGLIVLLIALAVSFVLYPAWLSNMLSFNRTLPTVWWNLVGRIWPYTLLLGLPLLAWGWYSKDERYLLAASPLLSPYLLIGSLIPVWLLICGKFKGTWALVSCIGLWLVLLFLVYM